MKIKSLILFCFLLDILKGQDAKLDFKKINETYSNIEKLKVNLKYELFFDNEVKPTETESGLYKRNGNNFYMKQTDSEMLMNEHYTMVIDNENKVLILEKANKKSKILNPLKMDLDSIFHFYKKVSFYKTGANQELHGYSFVLKSGVYSVIDVVFDPKTFYVKEIINTYREKMPDEKEVLRTAKLKTVFENMSVDPIFTNDFSETKYVYEDKGSVKPTSTYSKYQLLTNLKKL